MLKLSLLALLCLLAGCSTAPAPRSSSCILGDPSGSFECQAQTYNYAR